MYHCCLLLMYMWPSAAARRRVLMHSMKPNATRLLAGVVFIWLMAGVLPCLEALQLADASVGRMSSTTAAGTASRKLRQDCSTVDRCGSSCKPCDAVQNGEPTCVHTLGSYSCGIKCDTGFQQKVANGVLYCGRGTGLKYHDHFIKTPRNVTKRNYIRWGDLRRRLQNMGAASPDTVAKMACGSTDVTFSCLDTLLMAVLPAAYNSNSSTDTGGYAYISPAQDQGDCAACTGFSLTAAAEAAVNVFKQQSWLSLSLSEQYISFCRMSDPIDCNSGGSFEGLRDNVARFGRLASRGCYPYMAAPQGNCNFGDTCAKEDTQLPAGAGFSMAYDGSALDTVAKMKQAIMLNGGVLTALARLPAFDNLNCTTPYDAEAPADEPLDWHAVFCYGWADALNKTGEGYWICKNSWGTSWGCDGTFLLTYGAAYGMPVDYTYAVQYGPTTMSAKQAKAQRWLQLGKRSNQATINGTECVMYKVKKGIRLVKLHEMLATFASTTAAIVNPAQILLDLVTYNSGFVRNLAVASSQFRVCGNARNLLVAALDGNISTTNPQVAALLRIKESIDTTGKLSDWSIAAGANPNYCSWTGLSCDTSRQVIGITLWSKYVTGLKGQLPPATAFQDLGGLTKLTLSEQPGISGTLPIDWSQLQLQDVRIGENSMTGTIPVTWGNMTNLQVLQLSGNKLTGPIPASFGALASLQVLKLFKNKLYGRIPDSLGGLTAMQDLQLAENSLTGSIPSALSNLWSLKVLYLWGNLLTGSIPSSFGALESLEDIQLSKNVLTGTIPSSLGSLTKITSLVLGNNQLTGRIPATLGSLTSLQHLVLTDNKLTGSLPGALTALKGLKSLLIETNMLTGSIPAWLGQLTNLQYVALANNKLTGTLPNAFSNLAELKTLDLGINKLVGTLPDGYQSLAQLTILSLATNNLKGAIPAFWSNMRDLRKLYLYDNPGMTGCLPHTWQALLEGNNWDVDKYVLYRTQLTGFCPA